MLTPFERGLIAHLIADWLFQNDLMANNKTNLRHPAAWTHAAIQAATLTVALGWQTGLILGLIHLLVDTRYPLRCWQRVFRQTVNGPATLHISIWGDHVIHIITIVLWIAFLEYAF